MNLTPYEQLLNLILNNPNQKTFTYSGPLSFDETENFHNRMDNIRSIDYDVIYTTITFN